MSDHADFRTHTVDRDGVGLHVRDYGDPDGPLVIALHGWPDSGRGWHRVATLLADRFRVVVPDNRGFGRSDMPTGTDNYRMTQLIGDVLGVADWAGSDEFCLVGHDFGGAVTWAVGMFAPQRIRRAVVLCAPHPMRMHSVAGNLRQTARSAYTFLMNIGERGEAVLAAEDFGVVERFAFGDNAAIPDEERAAYKAEWREPGRFTAMAEWYRAHYTPDLLNPDVELRLPPVRFPVRYIHGTQDFAFVEELAETNAPFVDADYDHVLVDAGHWVLYERPDEAARLVAEWFES